MHPPQGLYWPSRRILFRRRSAGPARLFLWFVSAAVATLAAAAYLHLL